MQAALIVLLIYTVLPFILVLNLDILLRLRGRKEKRDILPFPEGLELEEEFVAAGDDVRLQIWWIKAREPTRNTILFIHGNARNITYFGDFFTNMRNKTRANLCAVSLRGYGKSGGRLTFKNVIPDLKSVTEHIRARYAVEPGDIIVHGRSQGASIAAELAARLKLKGLIVESGLSDLNDLIGSIFKKTVIFYPFSYLKMAALKTKAFNTYVNLKKISCPVLLIHGKQDRQVPVECAVKNHSANEKNRIVLIDKADHKNCPDAPVYYDAINEVFCL